jgi:uncharacterized protein YbjQ (UPF0145 family)
MSVWMTTTNSFETHTIREYRGVVTGEAIVGTNFMKDWFANISDVLGGRSGSYEKDLAKARQFAYDAMTEETQALGCNGIVGIDIDYMVVGEKNAMMMVSVSGTAVIVQ